MPDQSTVAERRANISLILAAISAIVAISGFVVSLHTYRIQAQNLLINLPNLQVVVWRSLSDRKPNLHIDIYNPGAPQIVNAVAFLLPPKQDNLVQTLTLARKGEILGLPKRLDRNDCLRITLYPNEIPDIAEIRTVTNLIVISSTGAHYRPDPEGVQTLLQFLRDCQSGH